MFFLWGAAAAVVFGCPFFTEFFPDPSEVSDQEGEFIEVRWDNHEDVVWDTLYVRFEERTPFFWVREKGKSRILWHRDIEQCPNSASLACKTLSSQALPNSRNSVWSLRAGACLDTAYIPVPRAGKSFQRSGPNFNDWSLTYTTPGTAHPEYETGIRDCRVQIQKTSQTDNRWEIQMELVGCDTVEALFRLFSMNDAYLQDEWTKTIRGTDTIVSSFVSQSLRLQIVFPEDDYPINDLWDTLFTLPSYIPAFISEVHPCPEEPIPEWVEIYNDSERAFPLSRINFCHRASVKMLSEDSLKPRESLLISKDTLALREWIGVEEVKIAYASLGSLKNISDTLRLCLDSLELDFVIWGKSAFIQSDCPNGFNPKTRQKESSPGFQKSGSRNTLQESTFKPYWNSRVFSFQRRDFPLMAAVESEKNVKVELLSGKGLLLWSFEISGGHSGKEWVEIPLFEKGAVGANYLRFSEGRHEKVVGIILRP